jgi:electron transfer flavoprotein alpha subunit
MSVVCLVEHYDDEVIEASLRALSFSRSLAESSSETLAAVLVGPVPGSVLETLGRYAVAEVSSLLFKELTSYAPVVLARALFELTACQAVTALVAAGTDRGNEVMAHVGALSGLSLVANCLRATREDATSVRLTRQRWAGSLVEHAVLDASLGLFTVAFDGVAAPPAKEPTSPALKERHVVPNEADLAVRVCEWKEQTSGISLAEAKVVVGGGRGVGSAEGFADLEELAGLLGAAVGVSRAVTSAGWRPHSQQVGQTGTRISPDLYLACGISGAIQHLAGCQSAKHVIAVNTDPDAPMISRADYAVIGDLGVIIPALVTAIRARGGTA